MKSIRVKTKSIWEKEKEMGKRAWVKTKTHWQQGARQSLNQEQSTGVDNWQNYPSLIIHAQKSRALGSIGLLTPK
jgi:hypothetical protein